MSDLEVRVGRTRRTAELPELTGPAPDAARRADPQAWPSDLAALAARERWRERHRGIRVVEGVRAGAPVGGVELVAALADAGRTAAADGARRLDLRLPAGHPAVPWLEADGWVVGGLARSDGGEVVASRLLALPWARGARPLGAWAAPLPPSARRVLRRARELDPSQVPARARALVREATGGLRDRRRPPAPEARPRAGAPEGSHPFAATRYATVDQALDRVAPALRSTTLVDIGSGDGRVLRRALDRGQAAAVGRELDAELAARSRALAPEAPVAVGDALAAPLPDDVGVVFLNNPFDAARVADLATLVGRSLDEHPRPLAVLYVNPPTIDPLVAIGLVPVDATSLLTVLVARER